MEEGLNLLREEHAVIHTFTGMLKGYFKSNPYRQQNLKIFARGKAEFSTLIVPINSPLKPILQAASNALTEAGSRDHLLRKWEGAEIPQTTTSAIEFTVLTGERYFDPILLSWIYKIRIQSRKYGSNFDINS